MSYQPSGSSILYTTCILLQTMPMEEPLSVAGLKLWKIYDSESQVICISKSIHNFLTTKMIWPRLIWLSEVNTFAEIFSTKNTMSSTSQQYGELEDIKCCNQYWQIKK